ncbi:MAG: ferrous iron transport protein B [Calditrichaeota bacterium]|nr:MAG: ferrous iron transport protein B [Calditrichota bacterium]
MAEVFHNQQLASSNEKKLNIALVGNPNCGKTTLFNALTGLRQKVANYPGVTVERKFGDFADSEGTKFRLIDLPGLYSIASRSLDEKIASDIITGSSPHEPPLDLIIVAADATNLGRGLFLCSQIDELGIPIILVLNMMDVAEKEGIKIDVQALSENLQIPIIPAVAKKEIGIPELRQAITTIKNQKKNPQKTGFLFSNIEKNGVVKPIISWFGNAHKMSAKVALIEALKVISDDKSLQRWTANSGDHELNGLVQKARESFSKNTIPWEQVEIQARYDAIDKIINKVVIHRPNPEPSLNDKIDRFLTHKILGPIIMFLVLSAIFQAVYSWAEAPMELIENSIASTGEVVRHYLPAGMLRDLLVDGVISGVGAVLVFLPQIMLLFLFVSILEDSGYLSRVAFILDRAMARIGLSGQSVIPLLSSFACAIPGIMAARTIHNTRDRLITILVAPFMSCSARLPVYTLMIGAFIPNIWFGGFFYLPALTLLGMYFLGIVISILSASLLGKFVIKGQSSNFIMELPPYRIPVWRFIFLRVYEAGSAFVKNAGKIILAISIILWFLATFPRTDSANNSNNIDQTYAGQLGHFIEPAIQPLGFDWKIGVGLITSFAAREVMVSTLGTLYNIQDADETSIGLRDAMKKDKNDITGKPVFTHLTALSLMVFFVLACQCMSTLAIIRRETNTWRWPLALFIYMLILAYSASFVLYQTGLFLGFT